MLILTALSAALSLSQALAGQIPVVHGVLGGVPNLHEHNPKNTRDVAGHNASLPVNPGNMRVVENSGVCETTPGVYHASGYVDLAHNQSIWFWFFAARENPDNAPLAIWLNGGDHDFLTINNVILYIDQPIGVGFSHGELLVDTSQKAATDVWNVLQIFFSNPRFTKYQCRPLAIWTESYGGHYGPTFAAHFLRQNAAIEAGRIKGEKLNLRILGIGNGLTDPLVQYPSYITYATNNSYRVLSTPEQLASVNSSLAECEKQATCYDHGSDLVCSNAQDFCNTNIPGPLINNLDWNPYYVRVSDYSYPPDFGDYINNASSHIGAEVPFVFVNSDMYRNFALTGDWMRNSRPDLEFIIDEGVHTLIYDGDADFIVNFIGVEAMVDRLQTRFSSAYARKTWKTYKVAGQAAGLYKKAGTFAYLRVYGSGHEVPAYTHGSLQYGQAALQFFNQVTFGEGLYST